jgi:hypothetical protein
LVESAEPLERISEEKFALLWKIPKEEIDLGMVGTDKGDRRRVLEIPPNGKSSINAT